MSRIIEEFKGISKLEIDDLNELYYFLKSDRWISLVKQTFLSNKLLKFLKTIIIHLVAIVDFIYAIV